MAATMNAGRQGHHGTRRRAAAAVIAVMVILIVMVTETGSAAVTDPVTSERPTVVDVPRAPSPDEPAPDPAPALPTPTPGTTVPPDVAPRVVPDPRGGDLRTNATADTLPDSYQPPPPHSTARDVPFGPHDAQRLDLHLPDPRSGGAAPVLVYLHAGGWVGGHQKDVPDFVMRFVERGYAVASVGYRLAPEFPFPEPVQQLVVAVPNLDCAAAHDPQPCLCRIAVERFPATMVLHHDLADRSVQVP